MSDAIINKPTCDGGMISVWADGRWDFTSPEGKHTRGQEETGPEALEAATNARKDWVLARWERGRSVSGGNWMAPLKL